MSDTTLINDVSINGNEELTTASDLSETLQDNTINALGVDASSRTIWVNGQPYGNAYVNIKDDHSIEAPIGAEIFNDFVHNVASGEYSHAGGINTIASGKSSFAIGQDNIAGLKGWYYGSIDPIDDTTIDVYISDSQMGDPNYPTWEGTTILSTLNPYEVLQADTVVSLINDVKYDNKFKVIEGEPGRIRLQTISGNLPFNSIAIESVLDPEDYSIYCLSMPTAGAVSVSESSMAEGRSTKALGACSHSEGYNTSASGKYAHAEGRDTEALYIAHAEGSQTKALGNASHAEGTGTQALNSNAHAEGFQTEVKGYAGHAEGTGTKVLSDYGHSEGELTEVSVNSKSAHAEGMRTKASNIAAHAEGRNTIAAGKYAHAEGYNEDNNEDYGAFCDISHTEGYATVTIGNANSGHAEGRFTTVSGMAAHAEGISNNASGEATHVEGKYTKATGEAAHAEGKGESDVNPNLASGNYSHVEGEKTKALGMAAHAEGGSSVATGNFSHSEGRFTRAHALCSHAEGFSVEGNEDSYGAFGPISHVEGYANTTTSTANSAHAEGRLNTAIGMGAHVEGISNIASGEASHAEGSNTTASGDYSHAGGLNTIASGKSSFAIGQDNKAISENSVAIGNNNIAGLKGWYYGSINPINDTTIDVYISDSQMVNPNYPTWGETTILSTLNPFEVLGDDTVVSVINSVKYDNKFKVIEGEPGRIRLQILSGSLPFSRIYETVTVHPQNYSIYCLSMPTAGVVGVSESCIAEGQSTKALEDNSHAEGYLTKAIGFASHAEGADTTALEDHSHAEGYNTTASGDNSHAEGGGTTASGASSHAEGSNTTASGPYSHAEGVSTTVAYNHIEEGDPTTTIKEKWTNKYFSLACGEGSHIEGKDNLAIGNYSHAEGYKTTTEEDFSHSEGTNTTASGLASHAEGYKTTASGSNSHAEGYNTTASAYSSHAEGFNTIASGTNSHAEGYYTTASGNYSHAEGKYNKSNDNTIHSVGIGADNDHRKNAHEILTTGEHYIYGIGGYDGTNPDESYDIVTYLPNMITITHEELVTLRSDSKLVPGQQYRITDYVTTTFQSNIEAEDNQFDIIVTADNESTLNEVARAIQHGGVNDYFKDSNLSAWQLWYCLDNDTSRFAWADNDSGAGKGVIYRMIDEFGNDCPYDFKNIRFKHPDNTTRYPYFYYTFSIVSGSNISDHSMITGYCFNNIIKEYIKETIQQLNNNIFINTTESSQCHSNNFGNNCYNNSFGEDCYNNSFGNGCYSNSFGDICCSNSFGNVCNFNRLGAECNGNTFGNDCYSNSFGGSCNFNSFGNNCDRNDFGDACECNSFGNGCASNLFGDGCSYNSFGNACTNNSFRRNENDSLQAPTKSSPVISYCRYNAFDDGCSYNILWTVGTPSDASPLKNINVKRGVSGSGISGDSFEYNIIYFVPYGPDYEIQVAMNPAGRIVDYCVADFDRRLTALEN